MSMIVDRLGKTETTNNNFNQKRKCRTTKNEKKREKNTSRKKNGTRR